MKIEVWSDFVCPFCYVGKKRLEQALKNTGLDKGTVVTYKAYQLDPNAPEISNESIHENLAAKYGTSVAQAKKMTEGIKEQARSVGLDYNFEGMTTANTRKAHRLAKWAEVLRKEHEFTEKLFYAYFIQGRKIGQEDILLEIAESAGLPIHGARGVLSTDDFTEEVEMDIRKARQIGIQGVPFFMINEKYAISGAQSAEAFEQALRKVAEEEGIKPVLQPLGNEEADKMTEVQREQGN